MPLTEEERKAKLEDLRKKLVEKRAKQAEDDTKANKANEVSLGIYLRFAVAALRVRWKGGHTRMLIWVPCGHAVVEA